jgi:hypothetical protein
MIRPVIMLLLTCGCVAGCASSAAPADSSPATPTQIRHIQQFLKPGLSLDHAYVARSQAHRNARVFAAHIVSMAWPDDHAEPWRLAREAPPPKDAVGVWIVTGPPDFTGGTTYASTRTPRAIRSRPMARRRRRKSRWQIPPPSICSDTLRRRFGERNGLRLVSWSTASNPNEQFVMSPTGHMTRRRASRTLANAGATVNRLDRDGFWFPEPGTPRVRNWVFAGAVVLFVSIAAILAMLAWPPGEPYISLFLTAEMGLVSMIPILARAHARWRFRRRQRRRNSMARRVQRDRKVEFFLYLRPFRAGGRVPIVVRDIPGRWVKRSPLSPYRRPYYIPPKADDLDLEAVLTWALERCGSVVALGKADAIGAGRVESPDAEWQQLFQDLVTRAELVFIVPAGSAGTQWEWRSIAADPALRRKTLVIVPPCYTPIRREDQKRLLDHRETPIRVDDKVPDAIGLEAVWTLRNQGIVVPERGGVIFRFDSPNEAMPFQGNFRNVLLTMEPQLKTRLIVRAW